MVNNRYVVGTLSHHIEELKDNKKRGLDINNLIWISDKTHNHIHSEYDKSVESKKDMQNKLFDILNKYYNDDKIVLEVIGGVLNEIFLYCSDTATLIFRREIAKM